MSQGAGQNGMGGKGGGMQAPPSPYSYTANRPTTTMTVNDYSGAANLPRLGDVRMQSDLGQQSRDFVAQFAESRNPQGAYFRPAPVFRPQPVTNPSDVFKFLPGNFNFPF